LAPPYASTNKPSGPRLSDTQPLERTSLSPRGGKGTLPLPRGPGRRRRRGRRSRRRASGARTGASAARATPVVDCLAAGASAPAPGDAAPAAGAGSGDGGAGSHLSGTTCPPTSSSSSSSSEDEYSPVPGEESPCCSRSRYSTFLRSRHFRCLVARSFLRTARSRSHCCTARPSARERGVGGSDFAVLTLTSCERNIEVRQQPEVSAKSKTEPRTPLTSLPVGSISRSHRDRSLRTDLGSTALRARVAA
jgi:hypothetical protein